MRRFTWYYLIIAASTFLSVAFAQESSQSGKTLISGAFLNTVRESSKADSGYTLDSFLGEALRNNPGLQAAGSRVKGAEARIPQAKAWDDPQAGVEFYNTPVTSANPFRDGMETDYFLQQMIPFFGKKSLMGDVATANVRVTEQSAAAVERNLIAEVKRAYAMLYSAQRRLDVNNENQRLLRQIIESTRAKYSVGITTQGDVFKVQVELAKLQNERSILEQELTSAVAMMNALRSVSATTLIGRVADITPEPFRETLDDLYARSIENRPELRGMRYEIEMNRAEVAASERERFPDFMIKGTYKQMVEGTDQWAAMVGINIPLAPWGVGKYSGKIDENKANVKAGEQSLTEMQNMVQFQVRDAWTKVLSRRQQIDRYQQTILPQAEQALQSTLASYQMDKADFLSLLDTYRLVQMFKMEYYMVVGEYFSGLAALERVVGSDLR